MSKFKRFFQPTARLTTSAGVVSNLDGLGLTFEWDIQRDNTNKADQATIRVFNMDPALARGISEAWQAFKDASGYLVTFDIGFDGVASTVIVGDVWSVKPEERTATDRIFVLEMGDGGKVLRDQTVGKTFAGVKIDIVLDYLVQFPASNTDAGGGGLGLTYPKSSKAVIKQAVSELPVQSWGNIAAGSNTREAIDVIMATLGLEWRVHNGAFVVMRGGLSNKPPYILRPSTGLISYSDKDAGGGEVVALSNPEIEPGSQLIVEDGSGGPNASRVFRVGTTRFAGTTGGESIMTIQAQKALL